MAPIGSVERAHGDLVGVEPVVWMITAGRGLPA
jgi:hypothetical protein